jgi:hypothetical protein
MSIDFRKAAAADLAHRVSLERRLADRISYNRLERDRLWQLRLDLPCESLTEAIDHADSLILNLCEARGHLSS